MAELKIDDMRAVKAEEAKEPAAHEKAAEKLKQAAKELYAGDSKSELEKTADKITGAFKKACNSILYGEAPTPEQAKQAIEAGDEYAIYSLDEIAAMDEAERELRAKQHDINVLRAELQDKIAELRDMKKTISKMQQTHEAELQDLKDQLGEMEAAIAALDKSKAEINRERIELIDAAESDDELFALILCLARALRRGAEQMADLAALLEEKVEVRR